MCCPQVGQIGQLGQVPRVGRPDRLVPERSAVELRKRLRHAVLRDLLFQESAYVLRALRENIRVSAPVPVQIQIEIGAAPVREHTASVARAHHAVRDLAAVIFRHRLQEALGQTHQGQSLLHRSRVPDKIVRPRPVPPDQQGAQVPEDRDLQRAHPLLRIGLCQNIVKRRGILSPALCPLQHFLHGPGIEQPPLHRIDQDLPLEGVSSVPSRSPVFLKAQVGGVRKDHIPGFHIQDGTPAAVGVLLFEEIPSGRQSGRVFGQKLQHHPRDPPVRGISPVALSQDPADAGCDHIRVVIGQRRQKLSVAVFDVGLPCVLAVSHLQHLAGSDSGQFSADTFQFHDGLVDPVLHKKELGRVESGECSVSSEEGQSFDQFVRLSEPLAVVDSALHALGLPGPADVQALIVAHDLDESSPALLLLPGLSVAPSPVDDLHRDPDLLIGRPKIDLSEIPSGMEPVSLHPVSERAGIADEVFTLKHRGSRRQKRARHGDCQPAVPPAAPFDHNAVVGRPLASRITSDLQDLRPDLFGIHEEFDRVLSAGRDQELLHVLLVSGILRESPVQHFLFFRDQ